MKKAFCDRCGKPLVRDMNFVGNVTTREIKLRDKNMAVSVAISGDDNDDICGHCAIVVATEVINEAMGVNEATEAKAP